MGTEALQDDTNRPASVTAGWLAVLAANAIMQAQTWAPWPMVGVPYVATGGMELLR